MHDHQRETLLDLCRIAEDSSLPDGQRWHAALQVVAAAGVILRNWSDRLQAVADAATNHGLHTSEV